MISASLPPINDFPKAFGYLTAPMMAIKPRSRGARFNAPMNPVLHAVSRLLDSAPGLPGALSAAGAVQMLLSGAHTLAFYGQAVAAAALLCLFFGQRLEQDYGGAATLVPYFLTALVLPPSGRYHF